MLRTLLCCTAMAAAAPFGSGAGPLAAQTPPDDCAYQVERSARLSASGAELLDVLHGSGALVVEGRPGLTEIRVRATACASERAFLDALQVETSRSGGTARVVARYPDLDGQGRSWGQDRYARLDMVVEVPAGLAAVVEDGSGSMELRGLGNLRVEDGSGAILLQDIAGWVEVDDGSGDVVADGVTGSLRLDDGSGSVDITGVDGDVEVEDGSGELVVARIGGSVILRDGSGGIEVRDVGRDLRVLEDGSGGIRHSGVRGTVEIPPRQRR